MDLELDLDQNIPEMVHTSIVEAMRGLHLAFNQVDFSTSKPGVIMVRGLDALSSDTTQLIADVVIDALVSFRRNEASAREQKYEGLPVFRSLIESGLAFERYPGVFLFTGAFSRVMAGLRRLLERRADALGAELLCVPSMVALDSLLREGRGTGHGIVTCTWDGGDTERAGGVALSPAVCHTLCNMIEGQSLQDTMIYSGVAKCFRHEPHFNEGLVRLREFTMWEIVGVGSESQVATLAGRAKVSCLDFLAQFELDVREISVVDLFFGATDVDKPVEKRELVVQSSEGAQLSLASINHHGNHFGRAWSIRASDDSVAHSFCVGVGLERVCFALVERFGVEIGRWPSSVRELIELT